MDMLPPGVCDCLACQAQTAVIHAYLDDEVDGQGYLCMNFPMHELETRTNLNGEQRVVITWDIRSGTLDHLEQVVHSAQDALRRALLERYAAQN